VKGGGEGTLRAKRRGSLILGGSEAGEAGCHQWPALKLSFNAPRLTAPVTGD
jgi:hypothetical protein